MKRSSYGMALVLVAAFVIVAWIAVGANHAGEELDQVVDSTLRLCTPLLAAVVLVSLWRALADPDRAARTLGVGACAALAAAVIAGWGGWGAAVGLAACVAALLFAPRREAAPAVEPLDPDRTP